MISTVQFQFNFKSQEKASVSTDEDLNVKTFNTLLLDAQKTNEETAIQNPISTNNTDKNPGEEADEKTDNDHSIFIDSQNVTPIFPMIENITVQQNSSTDTARVLDVETSNSDQKYISGNVYTESSIGSSNNSQIISQMSNYENNQTAGVMLGNEINQTVSQASNPENNQMVSQASNLKIDQTVSQASNLGIDQTVSQVSNLGNNQTVSQASNLGSNQTVSQASNLGIDQTISQASNLGIDQTISQASSQVSIQQTIPDIRSNQDINKMVNQIIKQQSTLTTKQISNSNYESPQITSQIGTQEYIDINRQIGNIKINHNIIQKVNQESNQGISLESSPILNDESLASTISKSQESISNITEKSETNIMLENAYPDINAKSNQALAGPNMLDKNSTTTTNQPVYTQVSDRILTSLKENQLNFKMKLTPQGLGELTVNMSYQNGKVSLEILTNVATTENLLMTQLGDLKSALEGNNFSVSHLNVSFDKGDMTLSSNDFGTLTNSGYSNKKGQNHNFKKEGSEYLNRENDSMIFMPQGFFNRGIINYRI
ncbi:MAG TPA: flagellar hook-length control protein FliK [Clostridia bacterium]|nr:flagellar hook-length control protein FliK [Clostridia bacterium]